MSPPTAEPGHRRLPRALGGLLLTIAALAGVDVARARPLVTARPALFMVGSGQGHATCAGVDPHGSRHGPSLPAPELAQIEWQGVVPGGLVANLLVDAEGRAFAVGPGRVSQLGPGGKLEFSHRTGPSGAVAAALSTDGTRVILSREGRVTGWSSAGTPVFELTLDAPPSGSGALLPLPDGGVAVVLGGWMFEIDALHAARSYAALPSVAKHAFVADGELLVIDDRGGLHVWNRREQPRLLGSLGGPAVAALVDGGGLVALSPSRGVQHFDLSTGVLRDLTRAGPSDLLPVLGRAAPGQWIAATRDGGWFVAQGGVAPTARQRRVPVDSPAHTELLASDAGVLAWWAADSGLRIETAPGVGTELSAVRCGAPLGLVPAGPEHLFAACGSGVLWLIGPGGAASGPTEQAPASE